MSSDDWLLIHEALIFARKNDEDFSKFLNRNYGKEYNALAIWVLGRNSDGGHDLIGSTYDILQEFKKLEDE